MSINKTEEKNLKIDKLRFQLSSHESFKQEEEKKIVIKRNLLTKSEQLSEFRKEEGRKV